MIHTIKVFAVMFAFYAAGAFVALEINPLDWPQEGRLALAIVSLCSLAALAAISKEEK
jgi:hypothetical protein